MASSLGVSLNCGEKLVTGIAPIPKHELIAVSASTKSVSVFKYSTQGEPIYVFEKHQGDVHGCVHLCDDILASVDSDGMLLTWRARTGVVKGRLKVTDDGCRSIATANAKGILVGTTVARGIIIVEHENGRKLKVKRRCDFTGEREESIWHISAWNDIFVAVGYRTAQIFNYSSGQSLHTIENKGIHCAAVNDDLIVMGGPGYEIYVHHVRDEFKLLRTIDLRQSHPSKSDNTYVWDISFINLDTLIVTRDTGILFISSQSGQCYSYCPVKDTNWADRTAVLSDGRVCLGGSQGYCDIFKPPHEVAHFLAEYSLCNQGS